MLGVARTLTSATRLLDVLPLLRPEDGVEVYCTVNPGSAFEDGLADYLGSLLDGRVLPWQEAVRRRFDLVVACAVHASMHELDGPLLVLPHGAGYNRLVRESTGEDLVAAGLSRQELTHRGRVVPALIALSHQDQAARLARSCPEAADRAVVLGDPCADRIAESTRLRDRYRRELEAVDGRRLVVVNSTWGEHSLLGRCPDLPLRLVRGLPVDEFAVALVAHPNVWAWHGRGDVLRRLAPAMDAGLQVVPPQRGWQAALIAADWVIGDHGSTTFYGADLGRVALLAAAGLEELDPQSPAAEFARRAPAFDPDADPYPQLLRAAEEFDPEGLRPVLDGQLAARGESPQLVRDAILGHLGLPAPAEPPSVDPVPAPAPERALERTAFEVDGTADGRTVRVRRYPLVGRRAGEEDEEARGFFAVTDEEGHDPWRLGAAVLARTVVPAEVPAAAWAERIAGELENVEVVVAALGEGRHLVRVRGGRWWVARAVGPEYEARPRLDPVVLGAAVYLWLESGGPPEGLGEGLRVRTGERETEVALRAVRPEPEALS